MGLHGSPTCVMRFDDATGWLIGEAGRGLNAMFVMMNAARLHVALQGIGLLDAALQKADAYAIERRQMRAPTQGHIARQSTEVADLIIEHPAVSRTLDTQRAWVNCGRVLAYTTGLELDMAKHHADQNRRAQANRWCSLVTPVLKSAFTDQGFHGTSACLQVFGGHGYVSEWGIEQIVRDSRVAMIYEGTNEIQAIDLLIRKVLPDGGAALNALLDTLMDGSANEVTGAKASPSLAANIHALKQVTSGLVEANKTNSTLPYWVAEDYLRAMALVLMHWANERLLPHEQFDAGTQAFGDWVLPELDMRLAIIRNKIA